MKVANFTAEELKAVIRESVEEVLAEYLTDPDEGLTLRSELRERLLAAEASDETDLPAEEVAAELGLTW